MSEPHNVLLVHGGFVDGSGWAAVYHLLKRDGFNVSVVQNPPLSLEGDAAATRQILDQEDGPVMLVGHSYGGAVISEAGTHDSVAGLVYVCAFAPDQGESVSSLLAGLPPDGPVPPILPPQDGFLFLDREKFAAAFAADVPTREGAFMADSQVPWGVEALNGTVSDPAWRSKPSWYLNTTEDRMIPPALQRTMAERTGATTTQVNDNHGWYKLHGQFFTADFPTTSAANPPVDQLLGVNDKDQAVGFFTDATAINHGYEFDISSGRYKEITVSGFSNITTSGINNHGDIVGFGTASDGNTHGFLLTNGGSRVAELSYPGAASTQPLGVNSNDEVVGVATVGSGSSAKMLGFTYYPGYGFRTINDPHGNGTTTINGVNACGVNACGDLVGFYVDGAGNTDGLLANAQFSPTASSTNASAARAAKKGKTKKVKTVLPKGC